MNSRVVRIHEINITPAADLQPPRSHVICPLYLLVYQTVSVSFACLLLLRFLCVSLSVGFVLFLVQLTGAHVFRALVVVCNESQINAACCHMRD